jgi:hypothetical protein
MQTPNQSIIQRSISAAVHIEKNVQRSLPPNDIQSMTESENTQYGRR